MLASLSFTRTVAFVLALSPLPGPALARQTALDTAGPDVGPTVELGVDLALNSRYLFRGMVYSDGPVTQVTAWASTDELYLYAWSNVALPAAAGARPLDEIDVGAAYRFARGAVTVEPAFDLYLTSHVELTTVPDARLRAYVARPTVIASGLTIGFAR